jgi:hypothetical protein
VVGLAISAVCPD